MRLCEHAIDNPRQHYYDVKIFSLGRLPGELEMQEQPKNNRLVVALFVFVILAVLIYSVVKKASSHHRSISNQMAATRMTVVMKAPMSLSGNSHRVSTLRDKLMIVISKRATQLSGQFWDKTQIEVSGDKITVHLVGVGKKDEKAALNTLTSGANLGFYWLRNVECRNNPSARYRMITDVQNGREVTSFCDKNTNRILQGNSPSDQSTIFKQVINAYDPIMNPKGLEPEVSVDDLEPVSQGENSYNGPAISIRFNRIATEKFYRFTRKHVDDVVAIVLDGKILSAPVIKTIITDGRAQIQGFKTLREAETIAQVLNSGTLPVPLKVISVSYR